MCGVAVADTMQQVNDQMNVELFPIEFAMIIHYHYPHDTTS